MHNLEYILIFYVLTHNVVFTTDIMVSMLVNRATAENSLKVMRNPDLSTSLIYVNIASIHSSGWDEPFQKTFCACLEIFGSSYRKDLTLHTKRSLSWFKSYQIAGGS